MNHENQMPFIKFIQIPWEVITHKNLNALQMIILSIIDVLDNGTKGCFASNQTIAEWCHVSPGTISNNLTALEKAGYIKRSFIRDEDNPNKIIGRSIRCVFDTARPGNHRLDDDTPTTLETLNGVSVDVVDGNANDFEGLGDTTPDTEECTPGHGRVCTPGTEECTPPARKSVHPRHGSVKVKIQDNNIRDNNIRDKTKSPPFRVKRERNPDHISWKEGKLDKKQQHFIEAKCDIVDEFDFDDAEYALLREFLLMLVEGNNLITDVSFRLQLRQLSGLPRTHRIVAIENTISRGWRSLQYAVEDIEKKSIRQPDFDTGAPAPQMSKEQLREIHKDLKKGAAF